MIFKELTPRFQRNQEKDNSGPIVDEGETSQPFGVRGVYNDEFNLIKQVVGVCMSTNGMFIEEVISSKVKSYNKCHKFWHSN